MASIITINFEDRTKPLSEVGLNKICLFTDSADIDYKEGNEITAFSELSSGMEGYKALELIFAQNKQDVAVFGVSKVTHSTVKDKLDKIADKDFFFIVTNIKDNDSLKAIGEWASAHDKIAVLTPDVAKSAEEMKTLAEGLNSSNVAIYAHAGNPAGSGMVYLNCGIAGLMSPKEAGSATWALKSPNLIPNIFFPLADENTLIKANVNVWANELGRGITKGGKTTDGSYVDITQGKYWLKNKLTSALALLLMNRDKLPFTSEGKTLITGAIEEVITAGDRQGIIVRDETTIYVPEPLELLTNDRANRVWNGIEIETRIQGAVESISCKFILNV